MIITLTDARSLGYCSRGMRPWCEQHGIDWATFVRHGVDESVLAPISDPMVQRLIERAHLRAQNGRE